MSRVILFETRPTDRYRHHRAEIFPYLAALGARLGRVVKWLFVDVPEPYMHAGGRYCVDLPPSMRARLLQAIDDAHADVVVFHDRPVAELLGAIESGREALSIVDLSRELMPTWAVRTTVTTASAWLGAEPRADDTLLLDAVEPVFDRAPLDERSGQGGRSPAAPEEVVRLAVQIGCHYRRPVRSNPYFRDLDSPGVNDYLGCSFCGTPLLCATDGADRDLDTPPVEHALAQVLAHQATLKEGDGRVTYLVEESRLSERVVELLDAVVASDLRPSGFVTMLRADVLLGRARKLELLLPAMTSAGHSLHLVSIGAENFSDRENERLNKNLTAQQLWDCLDLIEDLERRFPNGFSLADDGFAGILFTPWTEPRDLLANVDAAGRLGNDWLNKLIGTRLQLWGGVPVTELARHDGLVTDEFGSISSVLASCVSDPDQREHPWRFADPRTETIHRLLVRLEPIPAQASIDDNDPLRLELRRLRSTVAAPAAADYRRAVEAIIEAVGELGPEAEVDAVISHWRDRDGASAPGAAAFSRSEPQHSKPSGGLQGAWVPATSPVVVPLESGAAALEHRALDEIPAHAPTPAPHGDTPTFDDLLRRLPAGSRGPDWQLRQIAPKTDGTLILTVERRGERERLRWSDAGISHETDPAFAEALSRSLAEPVAAVRAHVARLAVGWPGGEGSSAHLATRLATLLVPGRSRWAGIAVQAISARPGAPVVVVLEDDGAGAPRHVEVHVDLVSDDDTADSARPRIVAVRQSRAPDDDRDGSGPEGGTILGLLVHALAVASRGL